MSNDQMNIQWYPGHMTKTRRQMEADVKLVDAVCEIVDARIPMSSRNPDIDSIFGNKPRIIILNRMDLADPAGTKEWIASYKRQGITAIVPGTGEDNKRNLIAPCFGNGPCESSCRTLHKVNRLYRLMLYGKSIKLTYLSGSKYLHTLQKYK